MTSRFPPGRERFRFSILPGISGELERLRRQGWGIERMRLDPEEDVLEVIAWRAAGGQQDAGARTAGA